MALTDAYATPLEYKAFVGASEDANDILLDHQLRAVSRVIDLQTNRFFNKDDSVQVRYYDGSDGDAYFLDEVNFRMIWIAQREKYIYPTSTKLMLLDDIATTSGLIVKVDEDGDYVYEKTLVLNTDFWVGPFNIDKGPEPQPWRSLQLIPNNDKLTTWPGHVRSIEITAVYGWPSVPLAIKQAVILLTRELRDLQKAGVTLAIQEIDGALRLSPRAPNIIADIVRKYGRTRASWA